MKADDVVEIAPQVYPTGTTFINSEGTKISFKSACQTCGYSLYWCKCDPPIVLGREVIASKERSTSSTQL